MFIHEHQYSHSHTQDKYNIVHSDMFGDLDRFVKGINYLKAIVYQTYKQMHISELEPFCKYLSLVEIAKDKIFDNNSHK